MSVLELTNKNKMSGSIDIIMGCMFSGKSTELIRLANRYRVLDMNVLAVNHCLDNRYHESAVATHSDIKMDCLSINTMFFFECFGHISGQIWAWNTRTIRRVLPVP